MPCAAQPRELSTCCGSVDALFACARAHDHRLDVHPPMPVQPEEVQEQSVDSADCSLTLRNCCQCVSVSGHASCCGCLGHTAAAFWASERKLAPAPSVCQALDERSTIDRSERVAARKAVRATSVEGARFSGKQFDAVLPHAHFAAKGCCSQRLSLACRTFEHGRALAASRPRSTQSATAEHGKVPCRPASC